jgi:hypothetical protein
VFRYRNGFLIPDENENQKIEKRFRSACRRHHHRHTLLISFVIVNVALKQLIISNAYQASQYAFYMADSGVECALFWDLKNPNISAFATSTTGSITCNNQAVTDGTESMLPTWSFICNGQNITAGPSSVIGGPSSVKTGGCGVSIFSINFGNSCAIVMVTKNADGTTKIDSRGYNTCTPGSLRRYERGITTTY